MTTWWNRVAEAMTAWILANRSQIRLTIVSIARAAKLTAWHARAPFRIFQKLNVASIKTFLFSTAFLQTCVLLINSFSKALLMLLIVSHRILASTNRVTAPLATMWTVVFTGTLPIAVSVGRQAALFTGWGATSIPAGDEIAITVAIAQIPKRGIAIKIKAYQFLPI